MKGILTFFKGAKPYQYIIWTVLAVITILAIYTPEHFFFKRLANHAVQLMFGCLVLGLSFMAFRDPKSMWVSLACCGILCLHLRTREPFYPIQYGTFFKVAHVNIENSTDYEKTIKAIIESNPDIISLQNLDPNWDYVIKEYLAETYPYEKTFISLDVYNPGIYSKYPFTAIDTFHYKNAPNIYGSVEIDNQEVHFISSITTPPVDMNAYKEINQHLEVISNFITKIDNPLIAVGDYNVVTHSSEMNMLRTKGQLKDSRTNQTLIGESPIDHILYSKELECTDFVSINEAGNNRVGIMGTYQFSRKYARKEKKKSTSDQNQ